MLTRTVVRGRTAGAIIVDGGTLVLAECAVRDSHASSGGAISVLGNATVHAELSYFTNNSASVNGGALQVFLLARGPPFPAMNVIPDACPRSVHRSTAGMSTCRTRPYSSTIQRLEEAAAQ